MSYSGRFLKGETNEEVNNSPGFEEDPSFNNYFRAACIQAEKCLDGRPGDFSFDATEYFGLNLAALAARADYGKWARVMVGIKSLGPGDLVKQNYWLKDGLSGLPLSPRAESWELLTRYLEENPRVLKPRPESGRPLIDLRTGLYHLQLEKQLAGFKFSPGRSLEVVFAQISPDLEKWLESLATTESRKNLINNLVDEQKIWVRATLSQDRVGRLMASDWRLVLTDEIPITNFCPNQNVLMREVSEKLPLALKLIRQQQKSSEIQTKTALSSNPPEAFSSTRLLVAKAETASEGRIRDAVNGKVKDLLKR